ncbi:MAG: hypothetical protein ACR2MS_02695 [Weeksellaceae bacterium]
MKSIWIANFKDNEIKVENTWFHGERLYINGKLQDEKFSIFSSNLTGKIQNEMIKVNLGGFFKVKCSVFVNDTKIKIKQIK